MSLIENPTLGQCFLEHGCQISPLPRKIIYQRLVAVERRGAGSFGRVVYIANQVADQLACLAERRTGRSHLPADCIPSATVGYDGKGQLPIVIDNLKLQAVAGLG